VRFSIKKSASVHQRNREASWLSKLVRDVQHRQTDQIIGAGTTIDNNCYYARYLMQSLHHKRQTYQMFSSAADYRYGETKHARAGAKEDRMHFSSGRMITVDPEFQTNLTVPSRYFYKIFSFFSLLQDISG
jgi:hypothetical protein